MSPNQTNFIYRDILKIFFPEPSYKSLAAQYKAGVSATLKDASTGKNIDLPGVNKSHVRFLIISLLYNECAL